MKTKKQPDGTLAEVVNRELNGIETIFNLLLRTYSERFQSDLAHIQEAVEELDLEGKNGRRHMQDLRDMLVLIRLLEIKPAKGKRKDLKKLESLLEDLKGFIKDWKAVKAIKPTDRPR